MTTNSRCEIVELANEELEAAVGGLFGDLFGAVRDATAGAVGTGGRGKRGSHDPYDDGPGYPGRA